MVNLVHLPNGQTITISPVFGGLFFKANDLNIHHAVFPPGWTIVLQSEDNDDDHVLTTDNGEVLPKKHHVHRYRTPTLRNDALFISSISNPSTSDFKPASSPSRQIAMMLWATLWWYFHQVPLYSLTLIIFAPKLIMGEALSKSTFDYRSKSKTT